MTKEQLVTFMDWLDSKGYAKDFCTAHDFIAQVYLDQMNQQTGTNTLVMESLPPPQTTFWPCPNCSKETSETKWLCCCSQECCKEYMDKHIVMGRSELLPLEFVTYATGTTDNIVRQVYAEWLKKRQ